MDDQIKKELAEIQQWSLGLSLLKDDDLAKFVPNVLPKLLFKLNAKQIHPSLLREILAMISLTSKRIQGVDDGHTLIPIQVLITMLTQHIEYWRRHKADFYLSSYFINLSLTFVDMAIKLYVQSLHSQHLQANQSNMSQTQRIAYPVIDLNDSSPQSSSSQPPFINPDVMQCIFKLCTSMHELPNREHSYKLFHLFIQALPFIQYSPNNIDRNAQFFSALFEIDFDALVKAVDAKREAFKQRENEAQHKVLKAGYGDHAGGSAPEQKNSDDDDDDDDDEDDDDEMKDVAVQEQKTSDIDIVAQLSKQRKLGIDDDHPDRIAAVILTRATPATALPHIQMLIEYCSDFLLCRYSDNNSTNNTDNISCPPGLSAEVHKRVSKNYALLGNKLYLQTLHKSIVDFFYVQGIVCQLIGAEQVFATALIARFNGNVDFVLNAADKLYSKIKPDVNVEHAHIVSKLFELYLGQSDKKLTVAQRRSAGNSALKLQILGVLCKSNTACNRFPHAVKVVFDALFGARTYAKLKLSGLQFCQQVFVHAADSVQLQKLTPVFKQGLLKLLKRKENASSSDSENVFVESEKIRNIAYCTVAHLSTLPRAHKLFTKNLDILTLYFDRLQLEQKLEVKESILDGLKSLKQCFGNGWNSELSQSLLKFLMQRMEQKQTTNRARVVILEWLNELFPFDHAPIRMVNIFQLQFNDIHVKEYAKKGLLPRINRDETSPQLLMEKHGIHDSAMVTLQRYPSFAEFTGEAYQQLIASPTMQVTELTMQETLNFANKCLSANALIWCRQQPNDHSSDDDATNDNLLLQWLESNDETNEFRNEALYESLRKQSKYVHFQLAHSQEHGEDEFMLGCERYLQLLFYSIEKFPISQSKTETLHSKTLQYLVHLLCVCYPSFEVDSNKLRKLFEQILFNDSNLHTLFQRQLKDSILTRIQCSKLWALITVLTCDGNSAISVKVRTYHTSLFTSIVSHLSYQLQLKSKNNNNNRLKPHELLTGTLQQIVELDGALRGLSSVLSAKLFHQTPKRVTVTPEMRLYAWLCAVFVLSRDLDLIQSACFGLTLFGKYNVMTLLQKKDAILANDEAVQSLSAALNVDPAMVTTVQRVIQVCSDDGSNQKSGGDDQENNVSRVSDGVSLMQFVTLIIKRFNKNQAYIAESAIQSLASIARGIESEAQLEKIETFLYELRKLPQEDLQFTIGSVWANLVFAAHSMSKVQTDQEAEIKMDVDDEANDQNESGSAVGNNNKSYVDKILHKICNDQMRYDNKLARCAGCIWLLCIVRFSGQLDCIQQRLMIIQNAFIASLSDSNAFTVECASKGLAHCYEMAKECDTGAVDAAASNALLSSLMLTLGKGKGQKMVHGDTEIQHKEGTSTYKELCQIAKNLNQPTLAYRFLDLANNHALWNSKRGAAFSLNSLLKISDELRGKMEEIIPMLYRYKFDVNPQIRRTMHTLWRSVVSSNKMGLDEDALVEKYYDAIMKNVIEGLQTKEWRVRASTPLAVCDLVAGKRFSRVQPYLPKLLENLFLVVQDINSMVKKSAVQMSQTMLSLIERLVNPELTPSKAVVETLSIVIPLVVDPIKAGIETRSKEVQVLSVTLLLKLCTAKTGTFLCPHLKHLIKELLIGMSTLEPSILNSLAVQNQGQDFANQVESARIRMAKSNPLNAALDTCIDLIDDVETINHVVPELANIVKGGIGLNSLDAACKILSNLADKKYLHLVLRKYSKKVMNALLVQVRNTPSAHLKQQYASVIGHWCVFAKKTYVTNATQLIEDLYFNQDTGVQNTDQRVLSGILSYNVAKYALDAIKKYPSVLALAFIATYDVHSECADYWLKTMDECGGKQMCLITNMDVTVQLVIRTFNDSLYERKQTAILAIKDLCELCKDDIDMVLLQNLVRHILEALPGKIWEGKSKLFESLAHICKHCRVLIQSNTALRQQMIGALLVEIQRKKLEYRMAALNAFGEIVVSLNAEVSKVEKQIVVMDECVPIVKAIFAEYNTKEQQMIEQNVTDHARKMELKQRFRKDQELLSCAIRFLGHVFNGQHDMMQLTYMAFIVNECYVYYLKRTEWMAQVAIYKSMQTLCDTLNAHILDADLLSVFLQAIMDGFDDLKYTAVRHQSVCAMYKLLLLLKKKKEIQIVDQALMQQIRTKIEFMASNDDKPIVVQQAIKLKKDIFL